MNSDGISNDELLGIAVAINADLQRQRLAVEEGPPEEVIHFTPREERLAREHQQRQDRLNGVDREADRERVLIQRLRRQEGLDRDPDWAIKIRPYNSLVPGV
jgi:hypothetical protein